MRALLVILSLWLLVAPLAAEQAQEFSVDELQRKGEVGLRLNNLTPYVITVRLRVELKGATVEKNPVVLVMGPRQSAEAMQIRFGQVPWSYQYSYDWLYGDYQARHRHRAYRLPFEKGKEFEVIQGFKGDFSHHGEESFAVDFGMPEGSPVLAARAGRVVRTRSDSTVGGPDRKYRDNANYVTVMHKDGTLAEYYHLKFQGVVVRPGQKVRAGQLLGYSGSTGFADGPHLHFMVYRPRADGKSSESLPMKFRVAGSGRPQSPVHGHRYRAP